MIDRLAMGDRQQPAAQVTVVLELRVRPQRREEGLLKAVLGVAWTDAGDQESQHVVLMAFEQLLERGQLLRH